MRKALFSFLEQIAEHDENVYLMVGDLGFSYIEKFKEKYPKQFLNAGIAEQNMIGMAAGMAMMGKRVYIYSIIPFTTMRCFEQIRNNLCYPPLPVTIIGFGGGFSYGAQGVTHQAFEDISIMRTLPEMTIINPGCLQEVAPLAMQAYCISSPCYMRLSAIEATLPADMLVGLQPKLGNALEIIPSNNYCIVTTGNSLDLGYQVHKKLAESGLYMGLVNMHTIKPLDTDFFKTKKYKAVFTIEEHFLNGGLGEALAFYFCQEHHSNIIFHAFGIDDFYIYEAGNRAWLNQQAGLSVDVVANTIKQKLLAAQPTSISF